MIFWRSFASFLGFGANPGKVQNRVVDWAAIRHSSSGGLPKEVLADLRTDHAGEVGAVQIYEGILFVAKDPALVSFAKHHLSTEQKHLEIIESWLPRERRSKLLPLWRLAGFVTGAIPSFFGPRAVYATIETVETFVDQHYEEQVRALESFPELGALQQVLRKCQADEIAHRDDANVAFGAHKRTVLLSVWCSLVTQGSRAAVAVSRRI